MLLTDNLSNEGTGRCLTIKFFCCHVLGSHFFISWDNIIHQNSCLRPRMCLLGVLSIP